MEETHINSGDTGEFIPPLQKSLQDFLINDENDESLCNYKKILLGEASSGEYIIIDPTNSSLVIPKNLILKVEGKPDIILDISGDVKGLKNNPLVIKEGTLYSVQINFYVQRDMVYGLKYIQTFYRKGIKSNISFELLVDKTSHMIGCYGPSKDLKSFNTPIEEAPSGLMARGTYTVKSVFADDDKKEYFKWDWTLDIKKDWD